MRQKEHFSEYNKIKKKIFKNYGKSCSDNMNYMNEELNCNRKVLHATNETRIAAAKSTSWQCHQQLWESGTRPTTRISRWKCEHGGNRFHLSPPLYLIPTGGKTRACKLFQNKWHTWHGADVCGMFPPLVCVCVFVHAAVRAKLCPRQRKGKIKKAGRWRVWGSGGRAGAGRF